jgi:hypothetical protein
LCLVESDGRASCGELLLEKALVFDGGSQVVLFLLATFAILTVLGSVFAAEFLVSPAALLVLFSDFVGLSPFFPFKAKFG